MPEENVEIVRAGYEAFNRGDIEATLAPLDPAIEWWPASDEPITEPYRGYDEYRELLGEMRAYVPDLQAEVEECFAVGDHVVTCLRFWGKGGESGVPVEVHETNVARFRDGKIVEVREYREKSEALAALSQGSADTVTRLFNECWGPGRLDLVPEILHEDVVWTAIESAPDSGTRRGHAECRAYMNDWLESFDLVMQPIEETRRAPDGRLVCALHGVGTEKQSGLKTEMRFGAAFGFAADGRLLEIHEYASYQEALEAVGLRDQA